MEAALVSLANNAEQLGIIGILIIVLAVAAWMIRHLYNAEQKCADARLVDSEERGEIKKEVGILSGRLDTMYMLHQQTLSNTVQAKTPPPE
jgi:hypothetical protein